MTTQDVYVGISSAVLSAQSPLEEDVLACMIVLHTFDFILVSDCVLDDVVWPPGTQRKKLHAVTRRHAAEIIAEVTCHTGDQRVMDRWFAMYSSVTPYEVVESVPEPLRGKVEQCRAEMLKHPLLVDIVDAE